jgi:selenophosphate synthase
MTHKKKQTDIGDFPVKKLETVNKNVTLADTKTYGGLVISRAEKTEKMFKRKQNRVNKIIEEIK